MKTIPYNRSVKQRITRAKRQVRSSQAHRLVDYLYDHGPATSAQLSQACGIGNLSAAANVIRPHLFKVGLAIVADLPNPLIRNRFGEPSMIHEWRLVELR